MSDELSQRILQADAARSRSAQGQQAMPSAVNHGQATPSMSSSQQSPKTGHSFSFSKAAAAVSAAESRSAGIGRTDQTASPSKAASTAADMPVAEAQAPKAAPPMPTGDTDLDVFVAKLTLQALEQQRQAAGRSLEADVWPVGAEPPVPEEDPPRMDWQAELDLIRRTGETWERRRARLAAERAAARGGDGGVQQCFQGGSVSRGRRAWRFNSYRMAD